MLRQNIIVGPKQLPFTNLEKTPPDSQVAGKKTGKKTVKRTGQGTKDVAQKARVNVSATKVKTPVVKKNK